MRYFGETPAYQEAFRLENLAQEGNLVDAAGAFRRLDAAVGEVMHSMQGYLQSKVVKNACCSEDRPENNCRVFSKGGMP